MAQSTKANSVVKILTLGSVVSAMEGAGCWLGAGLLAAGWLSMLLLLLLLLLLAVAVASSMVLLLLLLLVLAVPLVCMVLSSPVWKNCEQSGGTQGGAQEAG